MILFKNHNKSGFTLIEVLLALAMMAAIISAALALQQTTFFNIVTYSQRLTGVLLIRNRFVDIAYAKAQNKSFENKKLIGTPPETTITYSEKKPSGKSSLKGIKNLVIGQGKAEWMNFDRKKSETLITFIFKPEKKKEVSS